MTNTAWTKINKFKKPNNNNNNNNNILASFMTVSLWRETHPYSCTFHLYVLLGKKDSNFLPFHSHSAAPITSKTSTSTRVSQTNKLTNFPQKAKLAGKSMKTLQLTCYYKHKPPSRLSEVSENERAHETQRVRDGHHYCLAFWILESWISICFATRSTMASPK